MTGNNNDTGGPIDEKSNQWFGASVSSSGEDGVIVVSDDQTFCPLNNVSSEWLYPLPLSLSLCKYRVADTQIIASPEKFIFEISSATLLSLSSLFYLWED